MSVALAVGSPAPVQINGKETKAAPLDLFMLGEIEQALKVGIIDLARQNLTGLTGDDKDRMIQKSFDKAASVTFDSPEMQAFLKSPRGACRFVSASLSPANPEMTPQAVGAAFVGKMAELQAVVEVIAFISGFGAVEEKGGAADNGKKFQQAEAETNVRDRAGVV